MNKYDDEMARVIKDWDSTECDKHWKIYGDENQDSEWMELRLTQKKQILTLMNFEEKKTSLRTYRMFYTYLHKVARDGIKKQQTFEEWVRPSRQLQFTHVGNVLIKNIMQIIKLGKDLAKADFMCKYANIEFPVEFKSYSSFTPRSNCLIVYIGRDNWHNTAYNLCYIDKRNNIVVYEQTHSLSDFEEAVVTYCERNL